MDSPRETCPERGVPGRYERAIASVWLLSHKCLSVYERSDNILVECIDAHFGAHGWAAYNSQRDFCVLGA